MNYIEENRALPRLRDDTVDLNELLIDHPGASFVFQLGNDLAIVDRAAKPDDMSMVIVSSKDGFLVEPFCHQDIFGVVIYRISRTL
jgi:hypothetical protein